MHVRYGTRRDQRGSPPPLNSLCNGVPRSGSARRREAEAEAEAVAAGAVAGGAGASSNAQLELELEQRALSFHRRPHTSSIHDSGRRAEAAGLRLSLSVRCGSVRFGRVPFRSDPILSISLIMNPYRNKSERSVMPKIERRVEQSRHSSLDPISRSLAER